MPHANAPVPESHAALHRGVSFLLAELFDGPPATNEAYMLNPGDVGLLRQVELLDAAAASARPFPGRTTVAAHIDHLLYGLDLLNRAAAGEANPWATADWTKSWERGHVDDAQWRDLLGRFRAATELWRLHLTTWSRWDDVSARGVLASLAHSTYHFGAIRQILAGAGKHDAKPV